MSSSVTLSSKLRTSRYSRSIRPISRLPKTPVHMDQWTFFSVESLRYFDATMSAPKNTRSRAHCSRPICRWYLARCTYTRVTRSVGMVTSARSSILATNSANLMCSGRLGCFLDVSGRPWSWPRAKSTVSTMTSTAYATTSLEILTSMSWRTAGECVAGSTRLNL